MTLIAVTHGLVLADSCRLTTKGYEFQTGKIFPYDKPIKMWSAKHKFKDVFYGYAGAGDAEVIKAAGELALMGSLDLVINRYKFVDELRMLNNENSFTLLLFGLDGVVELEGHSGKIALAYYTYRKYASVSIGSGCVAFNRLREEYKHVVCPVRSMFGAFSMEPTCGGAVEVWRLPTERSDKLTKLKVFDNRSLPECYEMMSEPHRFFFKKESKKWLTCVFQRSAKSSPSSSKTKISLKSPKAPASPKKCSVKPKRVSKSRRSNS